MADNPRFWVLGESLGHVTLEGSYFHTRENYDQLGVVSRPAALDRMHLYGARLHGGFGFTPTVSLFAQADVRFLNGFENTTNQTNRDNWGFGDAFVGARWMFYRTKSTDRVYPTEWAPNSWVFVAEGTWNFPMYDRADTGFFPLGEQSNDLTALGRLAWYTNEWLAFSASVGYTHRTASYAAVLPWNLRADFTFQQGYRFRLWADFQSYERLSKDGVSVTNVKQPDTFPNGSLLYKSYSPTLRTAILGAGYLLSRTWELTAGALMTATGINSAKGYGFHGGITYRPYQVPEIRYAEYREEQIVRLKNERKDLKRREVVRYGFRATILKVSTAGNYLRIAYGKNDRVSAGDTFMVLMPDDFSGLNRRPVAFARVVAVKPDAAFLRVEERYVKEVTIREGFEARRVFLAEQE